jgi:hypothetical protein
VQSLLRRPAIWLGYQPVRLLTRWLCHCPAESRQQRYARHSGLHRATLGGTAVLRQSTVCLCKHCSHTLGPVLPQPHGSQLGAIPEHCKTVARNQVIGTLTTWQAYGPTLSYAGVIMVLKSSFHAVPVIKQAGVQHSGQRQGRAGRGRGSKGRQDRAAAGHRMNKQARCFTTHCGF